MNSNIGLQNPYLQKPYTVSVIGAPVKEGQGRDGIENGPRAIRETGLFARIEEIGWELHDAGDISYEKTNDPPTAAGSKRAPTCGRASQALFTKSGEELAKGNFLLTLGGDHSVAIGSVSAVLKHRPETVVIWVDAHCDINTGTTSPSGNIHGMPVAMLMKLMGQKPGFEWTDDVPKLEPYRLVYIGVRDVDVGEKKTLRKLGIKTFSTNDIDKYGIGTVVEMALKDIDPYGDRPIHLSFDIDAVDPAVAPCTGVPVIGGLTFREAAFICESIAETERLCSMDFVELNPDINPPKAAECADLAKRFIACALGEELVWGTNAHAKSHQAMTAAHPQRHDL